MAGALKGEPVLNFKPPDGVVFALIDPKTGLLAQTKTTGAYLDAFIKGTEPKDYYSTDTSGAATGVNPVPDEESGF